ncbi:unnamed protein product [Oikopleura dioica]|uniref:Uncharacterized protein n=1 Tax=Oikopleura dioica TaxID=34765 RepID=E4Y5F1_OIKDI|nr:unnamed protein product [Oikopleura dioica]
MSSNPQRRWEDGWSNATGNNKYALIGWLNTSLTEIWAMDIEDLSCKLPKEINKVCEALETLDIKEILNKPGIAILAKLRVVSWTIAAIEDMIPPAMMWTYCKIYPAKSEIITLSELAAKNGGLYRTGSGRVKGQGLLIPNGITEIGFLRGPIEQRTTKYLVFWEEVRKRTDQNKMEEWMNKYFPRQREDGEDEKWLGQPLDLDMNLIRRITDCLIMVADGSNSWETKWRLVVGPYSKEHAKNTIQREEAATAQQRDEERTTSLLNAENKQINVEGIPVSVSGMSKSKTKLSCLFTIPYGLHPLNFAKLTWKREILGNAEDLENLIFNMMAKLTGNAVEAERISAAINNDRERTTGRNRTGKRMRDSPDEIRVMKPRLTSSPINSRKCPTGTQRNGQSPQEDNITAILLQGNPNELERSITLNITTGSEEQMIPIPDLSSLDISKQEDSEESNRKTNAKRKENTIMEKAGEKKTNSTKE